MEMQIRGLREPDAPAILSNLFRTSPNTAP